MVFVSRRISGSWLINIGNFVRIGQNEISVCDPSAIRDILMSHMNKVWMMPVLFTLTDLFKGPTYSIFSIPDSRYTPQMAATNCKDHMRRQTILAPGYTLTSLLKIEPYIDNALRLLENQLDKLSSLGEVVKFEEWFNYLAFDVIGEALFSQSFGFLEEGKDIDNTVKNNVFIRIYISLLGHFPWAHNFLLANPLIEFFRLTPSMHVFDTALSAVQAREKNNEVRQDMLQQWRSQLEKHPDRMPQKDILANASGNIAAGSDTTSSALQAFFYYMIHDPEMTSMLRKELDEAGLASVPTYEETQRLPILQACIKETYRFHPAVGIGLSRVAPPEGVTICGRFFASGTLLSVNPWAMHHMTTVFGLDASRFNPRRWLNIEKAREMDKVMIPFGAGYNQCPGKNLAHLEVSKTTAILMRDYEFKLVDPKRPWKFENYFTVAPHSWPCIVTRRGFKSAV
jgi:cytochrome P450